MERHPIAESWKVTPDRAKIAGLSTGISMSPGAKSPAETAVWSRKKTFPIRVPNGRTETTVKTVLEWGDR